MTGTQLARAIADICNTKPELDAKLAATLGKWLKDTIGKIATLEDYRQAAARGRSELITLYISILPSTDIARLAKKFDPLFPGLQAKGAEQQRSHILALIAGKTDPTPKPHSKQPPMAIDDILTLTDPIRRRIELTKHSPNQLKKAIKEKQIAGGFIGAKASKTEMIEHIQAALASGWPKLRSVLDESKY